MNRQVADLSGKKIIFISGILKNGGVARRISVLSNQLAEAGAQVYFVLTGGIDDEVYFNYHKNVQLVSLPQFSRHFKPTSGKKRSIKGVHFCIKGLKYSELALKKLSVNTINLYLKRKYLKSSLELRKFLLDHKGSILIPFGIEYYLNAYYASRGLGCKIIYAERVAPQTEKCSLEVLKFRKKMLAKADFSIFQTEDEREFYNSCSKKKTAVIPNPVSSDLPARFIGKRKHEIVNFCRIAEQKNLKLLIDAFISISSSYPDYKLLIYGNTVLPNEEQLRTQLIDFIKASGFDDKIFILPARADIHKAILSSAMFVCSSDFEGLSNSMLEALAIGMPCICTDCLGGGARDCIKNGVNGLLVPMQNTQALAQAMERFINNPDFAESCAKEAEKTKVLFSAENIGGRWIEAVKKCCK